MDSEELNDLSNYDHNPPFEEPEDDDLTCPICDGEAGTGEDLVCKFCNDDARLNERP